MGCVGHYILAYCIQLDCVEENFSKCKQLNPGKSLTHVRYLSSQQTNVNKSLGRQPLQVSLVDHSRTNVARKAHQPEYKLIKNSGQPKIDKL